LSGDISYNDDNSTNGGKDMTEAKKMRSPNFPAFPLERSLSQAKILLGKFKLSPVAFEVAVHNGLNLSPTSSAGLQTVAALTAYGLIEVKGSGKEKRVKITQLAYKIIEDYRPISPERDEAIREAAMRPTIFRKILLDYPSAPPDADALAHDLKFKYEFNPNAVSNFINAFLKTMSFAKVYESGIIGEEDVPIEEPEMQATTDKNMTTNSTYLRGSAHLAPASIEREIANYPIKGGTIRLLASGPVTQKAIDKLIKMLELSKEEFPENDISIASDAPDEQG
jgi:hypothetical protein